MNVELNERRKLKIDRLFSIFFFYFQFNETLIKQEKNRTGVRFIQI